MKKKYYRHIIFIAVLFTFFNASGLFAAKTEQSAASSLQTELDAISLQIKYLNLKVKDSQSSINRLERKVKNKKAEILDLENQINSLNEKQIQIARQINAIEKEIPEVKANMQELLQRFRGRLVQLHKIKQSTLLGSIFSAKNLNSFLNRFQMVKYLLENDKKLISQLKEKQQELNAATSKLEKKQKQQANIQKELAGKRKKVKLENSSLQAMLKTVVLEKKIFLQKQKKLASSKNELEKEIQKIETARSANTQSFEKDLAPTPPPKKITPAILPDSSPEGAKVMLFNWPVEKAKLKFYKAIGSDKTAALQIEAREQCEILAAGRGKVLYKGAISGLGNVIILGHHKGFSTVYANVGDIWVGMGQIVDKGETIGRLFAQDHPLHFEIRFAGKKQLPLSYLPPLELPNSN